MEEDYSDMLEDAEEQVAVGDDLSDAQLDSLEQTISSPREKSDIYNWFWKVVKLEKPFQLVRAGNLSIPEIGPHRVSVRDAMNLAALGNIFHHETFADYWLGQAGIISASSMAKKGWFMDLSISQRKIRERAKTGGDASGFLAKKKKWRPFQKEQNTETVE